MKRHRARALVTGITLFGLAIGTSERAARADTAPPANGGDAKASKPVVVWPTLTPLGDDASATPLHTPTAADEPLATRAKELDATLRDATQDLGFSLELDDRGPAPGHARDIDMIARAGRARPTETGPGASAGTWVVSARLEPYGNDTFLLRIVVVPPNGKELRARVEIVKATDVSLRGLVLLRDLLSPELPESARAESVVPVLAAPPVTPSRSPGRAVLAANGAVFGGYIGYSLVRSTGTNDPRVLYPLLTLGAAVGLGAGLLASEEWDVSTGDAWYLAAGAYWGAASGILLANTSTNQSEAPYAWGIGGGLAGVALGTFAVTRRHMDEGDALLTHSGAALGTWVGALVDFGYHGTTNETPYTGAGIGSAVGLVGAGAASIFVTVSPSRVLLLDLGAGLGSLAGAAVSSPLIFSGLTGDKTTPTDTRFFLAGTLAGTAVGGTVAWFLTRAPSAPKPLAWLNGTPAGGIIGQSLTKTGQVPIYGVGYSSTF